MIDRTELRTDGLLHCLGGLGSEQIRAKRPCLPLPPWRERIVVPPLRSRGRRYAKEPGQVRVIDAEGFACDAFGDVHEGKYRALNSAVKPSKRCHC